VGNLWKKTMKYESLRILMVLGFLLTACNSGAGGNFTTRSMRATEEVQALEVRGAANDVMALRELESHYGFEAMNADQERVHQNLVSLNDPASMYEEALTRAIQADHIIDNVEKRRKLEVALEAALSLAYKAAAIENLPFPAQNLTIQAIQKDIDKMLSAGSR
jgi:hypothetical protein